MRTSWAREAAFLSIGTNDLTQYALAMDRTNAQLASQIDSLHPSVLRLIAAAAKGAKAYNRSIGVCGALAADLTAVPLLIGLGIDELSGAAAGDFPASRRWCERSTSPRAAVPPTMR